jgi:integrase
VAGSNQRRQTGSGTIVSLNPKDKGRDTKDQLGPFEGRLRRVFSGKRLSSPKFRGKTRREVVFKLENWMSEFGWESLTRRQAPPAVTVGEYLAQWWHEAYHAWAETTRETNTSTYNCWLREEAFCALAFPPSKDDVKAFLARLPASCSRNTQHRIHKLLTTAFAAAVKDEKIPANPAKVSNAPRKPKSHAVAFHKLHEQRLIQHTTGMKFWEALTLLAFDSGCREQECLGLRVGAIDWERSEVLIREVLNTVGGVPRVKPVPKTDASYRTITLSRPTMLALKRLVSDSSALSAYVFTEPDGRLWTRTRFHGAWTALLKAAGVDHYTFHSTRHTMATRLLRQRYFLTAVSKRLGHRSPSVTLDTYSHCIPEDQHPLAAAFEVQIASYSSRESSEVREIGPPDGPLEAA